MKNQSELFKKIIGQLNQNEIQFKFACHFEMYQIGGSMGFNSEAFLATKRDLSSHFLLIQSRYNNVELSDMALRLLLHELGHWTGFKLNRTTIPTSGKSFRIRAIEEMIAETISKNLMKTLKLNTRNTDQASKDYLKRFRKDIKLTDYFYISNEVEKGVNLILNQFIEQNTKKVKAA